jgi:hypothetical protein
VCAQDSVWGGKYLCCVRVSGGKRFFLVVDHSKFPPNTFFLYVFQYNIYTYTGDQNMVSSVFVFEGSEKRQNGDLGRDEDV